MGGNKRDQWVILRVRPRPRTRTCRVKHRVDPKKLVWVGALSTNVARNKRQFDSSIQNLNSLLKMWSSVGLKFVHKYILLAFHVLCNDDDDRVSPQTTWCAIVVTSNTFVQNDMHKSLLEISVKCNITQIIMVSPEMYRNQVASCLFLSRLYQSLFLNFCSKHTCPYDSCPVSLMHFYIVVGSLCTSVSTLPASAPLLNRFISLIHQLSTSINGGL